MANRRSGDKQRRTAGWAGYAACSWALVFAAISFYWAVGGTIGIETQAPGIKELAREREPWFVAVLWLTGLLKLAAGLLALALVRPWGRAIPRFLLLVAAWGAGVVMALWGGLNLLVGLVVSGLRLAGIIGTPDSADTAALLWHLLLWDPFWLLGGLLFVVAVWRYQQETRSVPPVAPREVLRPARCGGTHPEYGRHRTR